MKHGAISAQLGVAFEGGQPPDNLRALARAADDAGAGTLWAASHLFQRDPITSAAMVLANTQRLSAGLMAMSPFIMHPVAITMAAAALNEWFPGRVTLSFGVGAPRDMAAVGLETDKPLTAIRESIVIARDLLNGETVTFKGERYQSAGRRLSSGQCAVPIVLAASGPRMLELAGAEADGVLISAGTSPAFIAWALEHVAAGEAKSGRQVHKAGLVYGAVSEDGHTARSSLRRNLAFILRGEHHAYNLSLAKTALDQAALADAFAAEDWPTVAQLVNDEVLDNHTASGTPAQVHRALQTYQAVGLDEIVLAGITNSGDLLRLLAVREVWDQHQNG